MCGRFFRDIPWSDYEAWLRLVSPSAPLNDPPEGDIRPTQMQPVIRYASPEGPEGGYRMDRMRWGLVPTWHRGALKAFKATTFNARAETVAEAPSFRAAYRARRCLVPASGWFEWVGPQGARTKWRIEMEGRSRFMFAGLWDAWRTPEGAMLESFTLLTQSAHGELAKLHSRAPVIVDEGQWAVWLDPTRPAATVLATSQDLAHRVTAA